MSPRERQISRRKWFFYSVAALALIACASVLLAPIFISGGAIGGIGIVRAGESGQQKDREGPAKTGASASDGMDAFRDLVENRPIDEEFLSALTGRITDIEKREGELERREKELRMLQSAITKDLQRLEQMRQDLKVMTDKIEAAATKADKEREKKISDAVRSFKGIGPEAAAESLLQMDLESGVIIVRQLTGEAVGGIFDAMAENVNAETDAKVAVPKREKMAKLWEHLVNPDRPFPEVDPSELKLP